MSVHAFFSANLMLAYTAYFIGTASPGPSNLAIMSVATNQGRKAALAFALGVISGSMCWATVAALGVSAALLAWSKLLVAIKLFGGLYLLWLAFKSGRTAWSGKAAASLNAAGEQRLSRFYVRGAMLHLPDLPGSARMVTVRNGAVQRVARIVWVDGQRCGLAFARPLSTDELEELLAAGSIARMRITATEAAEALRRAGAPNPAAALLPPEANFATLHAALATPAQIGANLLGQA